ncbi:MAG TPA: crossover junction endodeoxyribonuclease RuvC [Candidatus Pacearchaeota archaeon]|nr:crossover junction endodeoxyribonuclease RuvC [Candidatus Pacearchaeota archaeon]HPR79791.1 crossover junction endodeoxyribonuclease RuvC [Candidatus Pacearchaeota archaeon]
MIILGIDPGTATTGFGVIDYKKKNKKQIVCLDYGIIQTSPKQNMGERLIQLNFDLNEIIKKYKPEMAAVESLFFFKNLKTAMPVSQARGVIIYTLSKKNIPFIEVTPMQAKTSVTGYGKATKNQVQKMVQNLLCLEKLPKPDDAADALALAIYCADKCKFD